MANIQECIGRVKVHSLRGNDTQRFETIEYIFRREVFNKSKLLTFSGTAKIGDFGLATIRSESKFQIKSAILEEVDETMTTSVGTPIYSAPEIRYEMRQFSIMFSSGRKYNEKVDIFSLGISFFELIYKFETGMERAVVLRNIRVQIYPEDIKSIYSNQVSIIKELIQADPSGNKI